MDDMVNLLQETIGALEDNGKTTDDVLWIGNSENSWEWDEFSKKADFEYSNGLGLVYIPEDIVVVGKDWWLERYEYDGSEEWKFKTMPVRYSANENFVLKIDDLNKYFEEE